MYNCARRQKCNIFLVLISSIISSTSSSNSDYVNMLKIEKDIDQVFEKICFLQKNKRFLQYKLEATMLGANEMEDKIAMLKIEVSDLPNIPHNDIFKITKNIAKNWGVFNEDDIADMYVFSKQPDKCDKNVIIGFKTMKSKRKWLSCFKNGALSQGLKSLKGYKGVRVKYVCSNGYPMFFHVKMLDHVSRYKAFLMGVCQGRARTVNKFNRYRFWVNNSEIFGVYREPSGFQMRSFKINTFQDISREIF